MSFTHAGDVAGGLVALRSTSTKAPGGIAGDVARTKFAVVAPLVVSVADVQVGVLSDRTVVLLVFETFLTVQSLPAAAAAVLQTGLL